MRKEYYFILDRYKKGLFFRKEEGEFRINIKPFLQSEETS
jgi:hypothetical protein